MWCGMRTKKEQKPTTSNSNKMKFNYIYIRDGMDYSFRDLAKCMRVFHPNEMNKKQENFKIY